MSLASDYNIRVSNLPAPGSSTLRRPALERRTCGRSCSLALPFHLCHRIPSEKHDVQ